MNHQIQHFSSRDCSRPRMRTTQIVVNFFVFFFSFKGAVGFAFCFVALNDLWMFSQKTCSCSTDWKHWRKTKHVFLLWLHANANGGGHIVDDFGIPIDKASCQNKSNSNNEETFYQTSTIRQWILQTTNKQKANFMRQSEVMNEFLFFGQRMSCYFIFYLVVACRMSYYFWNKILSKLPKSVLISLLQSFCS